MTVLVDAAMRNAILMMRGVNTDQDFVERHRRAMRQGHDGRQQMRPEGAGLALGASTISVAVTVAVVMAKAWAAIRAVFFGAVGVQAQCVIDDLKAA